MKILFVDDNPIRCFRFLKHHPEAIITNTANDCIELLSLDSEWDVVCIEHYLYDQDIGDDDDDGTAADITEWLLLHKDETNIGRFIVHTLSMSQAFKLIVKLNRAGWKAEWKPFDELERELPLS
jgi:hypothetical protein